MIFKILRFFRAADPMPQWLTVLALAIGAYAAGIAVANPSGIDEALALLLLWQMFSASRGFVRPAAAGHFDAALVQWPRASVAIAHAMHSTWLVIALWMMVGVIELVRVQQPPLALESGRLAALLFISATSWAMALPTARLVTGSIWLAVIVAAATTRFGAEQYTTMLARPDGSPAQTAHALVVTLICPFLMLGNHVPPRAGATLALSVAAVAATGVGILFVRRRDYPLETAL